VGRSRRAFRRRDASSHVVVDETPAAEISVAALPPATAIFHRVARAQRCACVRLRASISSGSGSDLWPLHLTPTALPRRARQARRAQPARRTASTWVRRMRPPHVGSPGAPGATRAPAAQSENGDGAGLSSDPDSRSGGPKETEPEPRLRPGLWVRLTGGAGELMLAQTAAERHAGADDLQQLPQPRPPIMYRSSPLALFSHVTA